jgi:hypothetical protein
MRGPHGVVEAMFLLDTLHDTLAVAVCWLRTANLRILMERVALISPMVPD